jgi:hypothetical protein
MLNVSLAATFFVEAGAKSHIIAPLIAACAAIAIAIPYAATRSKLHMPGYIGIAILAFLVSLVFGELSGARRIAGSLAGVMLSIVCFLCVAVCIGAILALVVYRNPPET